MRVLKMSITILFLAFAISAKASEMTPPKTISGKFLMLTTREIAANAQFWLGSARLALPNPPEERGDKRSFCEDAFTASGLWKFLITSQKDILKTFTDDLQGQINSPNVKPETKVLYEEDRKTFSTLLLRLETSGHSLNSEDFRDYCSTPGSSYNDAALENKLNEQVMSKLKNDISDLLD